MPPGVSAVMGQGTDHCVIARRLRLPGREAGISSSGDCLVGRGP